MNYLFFDIECANCFNGAGKIYSFGYCLADADLNLICKEDIIINPNSKFDPYVKRNMLSYPISEIKSSQKFPHFYQKIKSLLENGIYGEIDGNINGNIDGNINGSINGDVDGGINGDVNGQITAIGFAISGDIGYLFSECRRYQLPPIKLVFADLRKIIESISEDGKCESLGKEYIKWCGTQPDQAHKSDADALYGLEIARAICTQKSTTLAQLIKDFPKSSGTTNEFKHSFFGEVKKPKPRRKPKSTQPNTQPPKSKQANTQPPKSKQANTQQSNT